MRRLTALALACSVLLTPRVAMAQEIGLYMMGEKLNDYCRTYLLLRRNPNQLFSTQQGYEAGICYGFVIGVMDHYTGLNSMATISGDPQPSYCSRAANAHSATEAVAIYLEQHPEDRDKVGFFLVRKILAEKFPC